MQSYSQNAIEMTAKKYGYTSSDLENEPLLKQAITAATIAYIYSKEENRSIIEKLNQQVQLKNAAADNVSAKEVTKDVYYAVDAVQSSKVKNNTQDLDASSNNNNNNDPTPTEKISLNPVHVENYFKEKIGELREAKKVHIQNIEMLREKFQAENLKSEENQATTVADQSVVAVRPKPSPINAKKTEENVLKFVSLADPAQQVKLIVEFLGVHLKPSQYPIIIREFQGMASKLVEMERMTIFIQNNSNLTQDNSNNITIDKNTVPGTMFSSKPVRTQTTPEPTNTNSEETKSSSINIGFNND